jgi:hypothetical protein
LTGATIGNVKYLRYADIDATGVSSPNLFSRSQDSITAERDGFIGTLMGNASYGQARTYAVQPFPAAVSCSPASTATPVTGDYVGFESFALNNLLPGTPKSSVTVYRRL